MILTTEDRMSLGLDSRQNDIQAYSPGPVLASTATVADTVINFEPFATDTLFRITTTQPLRFAVGPDAEATAQSEYMFTGAEVFFGRAGHRLSILPTAGGAVTLGTHRNFNWNHG